MKPIKSFQQNHYIPFVVYLLLILFAAFQAYYLGPKSFGSEFSYTHYNNYQIFKYSFIHLLEGSDLYKLYPGEHHDLYKYSPAFALFFGVFAWLPDLLGLIGWNLLNGLVLFIAVIKLKGLQIKDKNIALLLIAIEFMTSIQNTQSNALIAGLVLIAFSSLENRRYLLATFCIVSTIFIKIFGVVAFSMFIFYPKKGKLVFYSTIWTVIFFFIPLIVTKWDYFLSLYNSWLSLLSNDHAISYGFSVMGWLQTWFSLNMNKTYITLVGAILFLVPLLHVSKYKSYTFRYLFQCSVLIWVVIFNHKAESPTFVIAMAGVAIWFVAMEKNWNYVALLILAVIFTMLSPTDVFPKSIRNEWVGPYVLKAVPVIMIWLKLMYDLIFIKYKTSKSFSSYD